VSDPSADGAPASSSALFDVAFERSSDLLAVIRVAPDARLYAERINPVAAAFFARAFPPVLPDRWCEVDLETIFLRDAGLSPAQAAAILAPHREAARTGRLVTQTSDIHAASGERLVRRYDLHPILDAAGKVTHLLFHGTDLTALRHAEERFETVFRVSPVPMAITSLEQGRCLEANDAWLRFYGFSRDQAIGHTTPELGIWVERDERRRFAEGVRATAGVGRFPMRSRVAGGRIANCALTGERVRWEGEDAVLATVQELTDAEVARREAQELGERFAKLFEFTPVPLSLVRLRDNQRLLVNPAWLQLHEVTREQALVSAARFSVWAEAKDRQRMVEDLRRDGAVRNRQVTLRRGERPLDAIVSAVAVEMDGEACMVTATLDVTGLQAAMREAELQRARFEALFRLSPNPSAVAALEDGRYLAVNESWARAVGCTPAEMLGRTNADLGLWDSDDARVDLARRILAAPGLSHHRGRFRTRGGESREYVMSTDRIDWEGRPALLASMNDVTDLSRALEEIRRLNESLEQKVQDRTEELQTALREIEAFSYTVSHDLRAPLRHVSGFAGLLLERPSVRGDPEAADYAGRLGAAARRLGGMVDSLLEYSRLGRKQISTADVDLGAETKLIVAELASLAAGRRVRWDIGPLPVVRGDPTLLRLLMQNLLDNALKYTRRREEAVIEVGARREADHWVVHVRDNGVGFDMRYTGKLFGVFQRLHGEREFEGTGIGLAHAARIVERHGGRIWCDAAVDRGATFWFTLPAPGGP